MKIEIEIGDNYVAALAEAVSLGRILKTAKDACWSVEQQADEAAAERYNNCGSELEPLIDALDHLHHTVRNTIWRIKAKEKAVALLEAVEPSLVDWAIKVRRKYENPHYMEHYNKIVDILGIPRGTPSEPVIEWLDNRRV